MEIRRLRDEKQTLQNEQASRQDLKTRIDEMMRFLNDLPCELTEYEEDYICEDSLGKNNGLRRPHHS